MKAAEDCRPIATKVVRVAVRRPLTRDEEILRRVDEMLAADARARR
jgi:hypothetical protein